MSVIKEVKFTVLRRDANYPPEHYSAFDQEINRDGKFIWFWKDDGYSREYIHEDHIKSITVDVVMFDEEVK